MMSSRSYKAAASIDAALAELHRGANSKFDPAVVDAVDAEVRASAAAAAHAELTAGTHAPA